MCLSAITLCNACMVSLQPKHPQCMQELLCSVGFCTYVVEFVWFPRNIFIRLVASMRWKTVIITNGKILSVSWLWAVITTKGWRCKHQYLYCSTSKDTYHWKSKVSENSFSLLPKVKWRTRSPWLAHKVHLFVLNVELAILTCNSSNAWNSLQSSSMVSGKRLPNYLLLKIVLLEVRNNVRVGGPSVYSKS